MVSEVGIRSWAAACGFDFRGESQLLMWWTAECFGRVRSVTPVARDAYLLDWVAGRVRTTATPPPGAFVYWGDGGGGHVGLMLDGGRVFTASRHLAVSWAPRLGWTTRDEYEAETGAVYLGWSMQNGGNTVPFTPDDDAPGSWALGSWRFNPAWLSDPAASHAA